MSERTKKTARKRTARERKTKWIPMRREYGAIGGRVRRRIMRKIHY